MIKEFLLIVLTVVMAFIFGSCEYKTEGEIHHFRYNYSYKGFTQVMLPGGWYDPDYIYNLREKDDFIEKYEPVSAEWSYVEEKNLFSVQEYCTVYIKYDKSTYLEAKDEMISELHISEDVLFDYHDYSFFVNNTWWDMGKRDRHSYTNDKYLLLVAFSEEKNVIISFGCVCVNNDIIKNPFKYISDFLQKNDTSVNWKELVVDE